MVDVKLYHGDCLEVMKALSDGCIDCVFADPPFNANKEYRDGADDNLPVDEYYAWLEDRLAQLVRVLKQGGALWLMQDQRHIGWCQIALQNMGMTFQNLVAWVYTNPTPTTRGFPKTWRPILLMAKGNLSFFDSRADEMTRVTLYHNPERAKTHYPHDVWSDIPKLVGGFLAQPELILDDDGRFAHLAQMPLAIARRVVLTSTRAGDTVLDPFMGSGTVGEACKMLGRNFIGMEISKTYFSIVEKRIADAKLQIPMFSPESSAPVQESQAELF